MNKEPIAEIRLPNHHPAVSGTKAGDMIHVRAKRLPDPEPPKGLMDAGEAKQPQPMPLEARFHVHGIANKGPDPDEDMENAEEAGEGRPTGKKASPMDFVKARRAIKK